MIDISQNLKNLRKSRGYTIQTVCENANIPVRTYQNYEYGKREISVEALLKLCKFYGVTTDYLLGRETNNPFEGINLDEEDTQLILTLAKLPSNIRKCTLNLLLELIKEAQKIND